MEIFLSRNFAFITLYIIHYYKCFVKVKLNKITVKNKIDKLHLCKVHIIGHAFLGKVLTGARLRLKILALWTWL